jgi:ParB family chromosome partitioning protein
MTDTISTAPATEVQHHDPRTLLVDRNVRHDTRLDRDFIASISDLGVLVPVVAVRTPEGAVRVRFGHRRVLAAIEAERPTVPVIVAADEAISPSSSHSATVRR